jgi:glycosyltransferase involved in cell wall biosynthesis
MNTVEREYFNRSKKWYCYHKVTKSYFFRQVAGIVSVSNEICREFSGQGYPDKRQVIANGIDLENYEGLPSSDSGPPELVFIGHDQPWNGITKILKLATIKPNWRFHIIGDIEECRDKPDNVQFHGYMEQQEYVHLFRRADVGIGTLALYEKNMTEASPLKVREYLAYGLPVIVAYDDSDFLDNPPFLLQLPNSEDNIEAEVERIEEFLQEWDGQRVPRQAVEHINTQQKEAKRLDFFREVIGQTKL